MIKTACLVLDKRWYPAMILNYRKAFTLSLRDGADVLATHPIHKLHTINETFDIPIVIRVNEIIEPQMIYVNPSRFMIFVRDNWTCQYCGRSLSEKECTIDHVIPKSQGGPWSWTNLVTCCPECNQKKGNQIWQPMQKPYRPEPIIISLRRIVLQRKVDDITLDIWKQFLPLKTRIMVNRLQQICFI